MNTRYGNANRQPLSNEQLLSLAPSIFAENAHARTSDRYSFIPTLQIVNGLRDAGWNPVSVQEQRVRLDDRQGFQKHLIRYQRQDAAPVKVGDSVFELVTVNSHDLSSGFQFLAGLFRLVCSNGMIVSDATIGSISVAHRSLDVPSIIEASVEIADSVPLLAERVNDWRNHPLTEIEQKAFANAAAVVRWGEEAPINPHALLNARRYDDKGNDLWHTFNRVQENLTQGQRVGYGDRQNERPANRVIRKTRGVTGLSEDVRLNKALWTLAETLRNGRNPVEATA